MKYQFIPQEKPFFCLPACLQMVFQYRGIEYDPQRKIYLDYGGDLENKGLILKKGLIEKYLREHPYSLHCLDFYVRESQLKEFERFVEKALGENCDILCSFAYEDFIGKDYEINHTALIDTFDRDKEECRLIDPANEQGLSCSVLRLTRAMFKSSGAFHVFHPSQNVLQALGEKYF